MARGPITYLTKADRTAVRALFRRATRSPDARLRLGPRRRRRLAMVAVAALAIAAVAWSARAFFDGPDLAAMRELVVVALAAASLICALIVGGLSLVAAWNASVWLAERMGGAVRRRWEDRRLDGLARARLHDVLSRRVFAVERAGVSREALAPFDVGDLSSAPFAADADAHSDVVAAFADGVDGVRGLGYFFVGAPRLEEIVDWRRTRSGGVETLEVNPIRTTAFLIVGEDLVAVSSLIDLARGVALDDVVARVALSDIVATRREERLRPIGGATGAETLGRRPERRDRFVDAFDANAFLREQSVVAVYGGGEIVAPIGVARRIEIEPMAEAERDRNGAGADIAEDRLVDAFLRDLAAAKAALRGA